MSPPRSALLWFRSGVRPTRTARVPTVFTISSCRAGRRAPRAISKIVRSEGSACVRLAPMKSSRKSTRHSPGEAKRVARADKFEIRREGRWKLFAVPEIWRDDLWAEIRQRLEAARLGAHPQTLRLASSEQGATAYYLKLYAPPAAAARIKDFFRDSKALRALKKSAALSRLGFHVPPPLAAG